MKTIATLKRKLKDKRNPRKYLVGRFLWKSGIIRVLPLIIARHNYRLRFRPSALCAFLWADPEIQRVEDRIISAYVKTGDTVVDIGANIGVDTLSAALAVGSAGTVLCFEPSPRIFTYLRENIALNDLKNVTPFNVALGASEGTVAFDLSASDPQARVLEHGTQQVPLKRLDDMIEAAGNINTIHFLKIDVEGYELEVFRGAEQALEKTLVVYFEHVPWAFARYGHLESEILGVLRAHHFDIFRIKDDKTNLLAIRNLPVFLERVGDRIEIERLLDVQNP